MKAWCLRLAIFCGSLALPVAAQQPAEGAAQVDISRLDYRLQPRKIADGTWVIEGAVDDFAYSNGCNIINTAFIETGAGVWVINTGPSRLYGEQQRKAIAQVSPQPVVRVLNLNLHPDYFLGNQAWSDQPIQALAGSIEGMRAEGEAYTDNLYRQCRDWMRGTQATPAGESLQPQVLTLGTHTLELRRLHGHTQDDLVVLDRSTGVLFAGGLVFHQRVPTTPHAVAGDWIQSLDILGQWFAAGEFKQLVPSHGPVHEGMLGIAQTRDWLQWVTELMQQSASKGLDLAELLRTPVPNRFAAWAAQPAEFHRTLAHWYPQYEKQALGSLAP